MPQRLQFKVSSELKNIIGKELITDDFIAIFELVKNSFDARALRVDIVFDNIRSKRSPEKARLFIADNGDGMSYEDLENKWLFVAYSEKKPAEKPSINHDFRDKIQERRVFAGSKGIGRFSCDKLGSRLILYTKKENEKKIHCLRMNWDSFEKDPTKQFQKIDVFYDSYERLDIGIKLPDFKKGTILEISGLRSSWDRKKLLTLKRHLQRLINPSQLGENRELTIYLKAEEFAKGDKKYERDIEKNDHKIVNGVIRNVLFEKLGINTTKIKCTVDAAGNELFTELIDKGEFIYKVGEKNEYPRLKNINITLFYLNPPAKRIFTRQMGIAPVRYGSVFFYKNGVKINPCGNEGDDWLGLDRRKTQGQRRYLGNRDVMGRIEVNGFQPHFVEVSSRDGGVVKTDEFMMLKKLFEEKALRRLEKYVVEGINWDSENRPKKNEDAKADAFAIVSELAGQVADKEAKIEFNENLLQLYEEKQIEKTPELIKNIETIKNLITSKEDRAYVDLQVTAVKSAFRSLVDKRKELEEELKRRENEALFMKYEAGEEKKEIVALQHQIGLASEIVKNHLLLLKEKLDAGERPTNKDVASTIENVMLQVQIMASIASFISKAKFDLMAQEIEKDLMLYIKQYVEDIYVPLNEKKLGERNLIVKVHYDPKEKFVRRFNPFEFVVIIDNLISNSIKARARSVDIGLKVLATNELELRIKDDGSGIPDEALENLFKFGFSTTAGSGIGLFHVKKIVEDYGSITVNNKMEKGVEFIIKVSK